MIKTLRHVQKSSWKPEKRRDGVALSSGWCCPFVRTIAVSQSMSKHGIQLRVEIGEA
jgi:hypothetical protein